MHDWTKFDAQLNPPRKQEETKALQCPGCKSEYFEQIRAARYAVDHSLIPGQLLSELAPGAFTLLKCVKCGDLCEPKTILAANDPAVKPYRAFIDQMKAPNK